MRGSRSDPPPSPPPSPQSALNLLASLSMHSAEAVKETMSPAITPTLLAITTSHAPLANYSLPSLHALLTNATSSTLVMHALAPPPPMDDDAGYAPPPPSPV